ncbi:hypothetical protein C0989_007962, partial [Termitomyces sp. Mn162]
IFLIPKFLGLIITTFHFTTIDVAMNVFIHYSFLAVFITNKTKCRDVWIKKKYKPITLKTKPIASQILENFCIECKIVGDSLTILPTLDSNPPSFVPTEQFTNKHKATFVSKYDTSFLTSNKLNVLIDLIAKQN